MKMTTLMTAAAGMVLTVALTACGGGGAGSTTDPTTSGDASATTSAPAGEAGGSVGVSMPTQTTERWIADGAAVKQALADIAQKQRQMARPTAGGDAHLAADRTRRDHAAWIASDAG